MITSKLSGCVLGLCVVTLFCSQTSAAIVTLWNETTQGELSGTIGTPTVINTPLTANEHRVIGTTISSPIDRDFFTITIAPGHQLSSLFLRAYSNTDTAGGHLLSVFQGTLTAIPPNTAAGQSQLMGALIVGTGALNTNVLPNLGLSPAAPSAQKFTPPLAAGIPYTFWVQENAGTLNYTYEFVVTAVPEPSTALLASIGLAALSFGRRRRNND